jgi:hypothetical protein
LVEPLTIVGLFKPLLIVGGAEWALFPSRYVRRGGQVVLVRHLQEERPEWQGDARGVFFLSLAEDLRLCTHVFEP